MNAIYFDNPALLHLMWVLLLQATLMGAYWHWRRHTLRRLGSPALEQRLLQGFSETRFWLKNLLFAGGIASVVLAIASPVAIEKSAGSPRWSSEVVIALDVSNSMLAKDVAPSRLEQAKKFVQRLTAALDGERLGLIFFAGEAYAQMPLSTDYEALMMFVRNAQPDFITDQGTDIGAAVALAERMLETGKSAGRAIILVSDGENHEEAAMQRVREAQESGIVLYTVSVGSAGGTTIPAGRGAFRRDFSGQPVRTSANESLMLSLAQAGGGQSFSLKEEDRAIEGLKLGVAQLRKSAVEAGATEQKVYYFPWLLLAALAFLLLEQVLWWRKP